MWKIKIHRITFSFLIFSVCFGQRDGREHEVVSDMGVPIDPAEYGDSFSWQTLRPIDLIEILKSRNGYTVWGIHKGWIQEKDIPELIKLLDSEEPCGDVSMSISSYHHPGRSTVGREAAFMIQGFRKGQYPPDLNSIRFEYEKEEIRAWWKKMESKGET